MQEFLRRLGTLIVALLGGNTGGMLVFPFGLVVAEFIIWPLAFVIGAIFAAIGAGWAGNLLAPGRSRLLPIVGVSVATAAVMTVAVLILMSNYLPTPGFVAEQAGIAPGRLADVVMGMVFIALGASWAAWRFRSPEPDLARDAALTLGLVGLAILVFVATLFVAGLFGLTGP